MCCSPLDLSTSLTTLHKVVIQELPHLGKPGLSGLGKPGLLGLSASPFMSPRRMSSGKGPRFVRTLRYQISLRQDSRSKLLTPFCLHPKEDPHPSSKHFQKLHDKNASLQVIEMIQMR